MPPSVNEEHSIIICTHEETCHSSLRALINSILSLGKCVLEYYYKTLSQILSQTQTLAQTQDHSL